MERLDRILDRFENVVIIASYLFLIGLVGVETVRRMLTGSQAIWGPELAIFCFIWMSWFAMSYHVRHGTNLSLLAIRQKLSKKKQLTLEVVDCLLWVSIGSIIMYESIGVVKINIEMNQTVFGTPIPLALAGIAVPIAWSVTTLRVIQRLCILLNNYFGERHRDAADNDNSELRHKNKSNMASR